MKKPSSGGIVSILIGPATRVPAMKRQRMAVMFLRYSKSMLAATVVVVLLSGCEYKAVDPELSATENVAVLSSLYDTYECSRIIEAANSYAGVVKHFDDLMGEVRKWLRERYGLWLGADQSACSSTCGRTGDE